MLHVMNNFDIPTGSVRSADDVELDHTRWTVVVNLAEIRCVVRSYVDPTPRLVDMAKVEVTDVVQVPLPADPAWHDLDLSSTT